MIEDTRFKEETDRGSPVVILENWRFLQGNKAMCNYYVILLVALV